MGVCEDKNAELAAIMMVEGYTCATALEDYESNMCENELFIPYCCQTCSMMEDCPKVMCRMYCEHGWVTDENGCSICECADAPVTPEVCDDKNAELAAIMMVEGYTCATALEDYESN